MRSRSRTTRCDSMVFISCGTMRTASSTAVNGIAKISPPTLTINAGIIANVSGSLIVNTQPLPGAESTSTEPLIFSR